MFRSALARPGLADAPTPSRLQVQVCPPSQRRALPMWWPLWLVTLKRSLSRHSERRLHAARADFLAAVTGLCGEASETLRARVRWARSMRELWHLRAATFEVLCTGLCEAAALERMAPLSRHFPTRSPRSGFGAFDDGAPR